MKIHTFELFALLSGFDRKELGDYFFFLARSNQRCTYRTGEAIHCNFWRGNGVLVTLKETPCGGSIHFKINPSELLENDDPLATFQPDRLNVKLVADALDNILKSFPITIDSSWLAVYRVDLCKDTYMPETICSEYIRLLRRRQIPQSWNRTVFGDERDQHSFRAGNGKYQITAYDKLYQIAQRGKTPEQSISSHILRLEVALLRNGILSMCKKYEYGLSTDLEWTEQLCLLSENGASIMERCFDKIASKAPYCTLAQARTFIEQSTHYSNKQSSLIAFLARINHCQTVDLRLIRTDSSSKKRLEQLERLAINPITIDARAGIDILPSPQQLVRENIISIG